MGKKEGMVSLRCRRFTPSSTSGVRWDLPFRRPPALIGLFGRTLAGGCSDVGRGRADGGGGGRVPGEADPPGRRATLQPLQRVRVHARVRERRKGALTRPVGVIVLSPRSMRIAEGSWVSCDASKAGGE